MAFLFALSRRERLSSSCGTHRATSTCGAHAHAHAHEPSQLHACHRVGDLAACAPPCRRNDTTQACRFALRTCSFEDCGAEGQRHGRGGRTASCWRAPSTCWTVRRGWARTMLSCAARRQRRRRREDASGRRSRDGVTCILSAQAARPAQLCNNQQEQPSTTRGEV